MKVHFGGRLFLVAAALGVAAVLAIGLLVALGGRSVVAGPDAASPAAAPTPVGHEWSQVEGHGTGTGLWWLGTTANQALELRVNNERALRLEPNATSPNVIGGHSGNSVTAGVVGAAICGGGQWAGTNRVTDHYGTVGGGVNNQAGDNAGTTNDRIYATVGGGWSNTASGNSATVGGGDVNNASAWMSTVGGGESNTASGEIATIGGGNSNNASNHGATIAGGSTNNAGGWESTVGGGETNSASGQYATVPGGYTNAASGQYSFAAGYHATADQNGAFVWADSSSSSSFAPERANQFRVRADGGARFDDGVYWVDIRDQFNHGSNIIIDTSSGAYLTRGGQWTNGSSRDRKENFTPVDGQEVLASLAEMTITTWNSKVEDPSIRHMGPVAQDFYGAFGLGASDTSIGTLDADGVALAAIQGLYALSQEQDARIDGLEARVAALEGGASTSGTAAGPLSGLSAGWLVVGGLVVVGLALVQRRRAGGRP